MAGNEDSVKHNGPPEDEPLGRVGPTSDNAATVARPADNQTSVNRGPTHGKGIVSRGVVAGTGHRLPTGQVPTQGNQRVIFRLVNAALVGGSENA